MLAPLAAHALTSDKQQNMLINSDYAKIVQNKDNNQPGVTYLDGNVTMDQGSTKARGDEATIYQHAADAKDAQGRDISGDVQRVILIGKKKQAHLEQQQDAGGLMTANSDKIDYNADTSIAVLTGNVVVSQPGRGQFKGAYMTYNTNTGEMEIGRQGERQPARADGHRAEEQGAGRRRGAEARDAAASQAPPTPKPAERPALMLSATGLQKSFRGRTVVRGFEFSLDEGEIVGLLGPNGAGKTTCFYMVVGLIPADAGTIRIDNVDVTELPMHARARLGVGYLPQEPSVFRRLSVADNILAILELREDLDNAGRSAELESLLDDLQIGHIADQKGLSLSGGERRRVEIARALAARPRFMLLDEPFAGIDPISVVDIQRIVLQLKSRGIGILITDHNVRETLGICERAYIMSDGAVLAQGAPAEILANEQVREVYLGKEFRM